MSQCRNHEPANRQFGEFEEKKILFNIFACYNWNSRELLSNITFLTLVLVILREIKIVFSLGKIFLSDEEIILFERYNAP